MANRKNAQNASCEANRRSDARLSEGPHHQQGGCGACDVLVVTVACAFGERFKMFMPPEARSPNKACAASLRRLLKALKSMANACDPLWQSTRQEPWKPSIAPETADGGRKSSGSGASSGTNE
eukprot:CAMPEP_0172947058 /NCGR_PEP_ID=MMETSP1075-20121228/227379_1 /TAXON_ID=2916 /ORGANISM="Ceratium fusus, Strain PA161109" /LENGTH=122 /DNA_ID=CAMNT_0013808525 /DNA_START=832 /DNA_END=1201 /DNA_ORIENTATION=-